MENFVKFFFVLLVGNKMEHLWDVILGNDGRWRSCWAYEKIEGKRFNIYGYIDSPQSYFVHVMCGEHFPPTKEEIEFFDNVFFAQMREQVGNHPICIYFEQGRVRFAHSACRDKENIKYLTDFTGHTDFPGVVTNAIKQGGGER